MKPALFLLALFAALAASAHPGGLDAKGGHTDHKTGIYHFHRGTNAPSGITTNASPVDVETNQIEMESGAVEPPKQDAGVLATLSKLPWWIYLAGLGCLYLVWEIASQLYQKRKGNQ